MAGYRTEDAKSQTSNLKKHSDSLAYLSVDLDNTFFHNQ